MASNNMSPLRNFLNSIKNSVYNISIDGIGNTDINASSLFNGFPNLYRTITLNDMNYVTDMSRIFNNTKNLSQIPNYNFNTSNVTNMSYMFRSCSNLTTIPNFNTSNVTNMSWMFEACYNLTNIPNFDTSKVTNMWYTFSSCSNLTNVPNFNTSNVTYMGYMFLQCYNLITIPNFNTSKVINMSQMFQYCRNLITIPNFNTSKVTNMSNMFKWCDKLTTIPNFNTSKVTDMSLMFNGCYNLTNIPILNITNLINMSRIFSYCSNLSQTSVNNIVASCSTASKVTNKNWTNIGFDVAAGSKWNTWIRTAPDYMNAVNIGWQNIGDAISAYKRRIMVGDNIITTLFFDFPDDYYKELINRTNITSSQLNFIRTEQTLHNTNFSSVFEQKQGDSYYITEYITDRSPGWIYAASSNGNIALNEKSLNIKEIAENDVPGYDDTNLVTEIDSSNPSYRHIYIEDENIRPLEVGDVIGPNTKFYFTLPDNIFELYANNQSNDLSVMPLAPPVGESIIKSNNIDIFTMTFAEQLIYFGTIRNGYEIFRGPLISSTNKIINESIYTVNLTDDLPESSGNLLPITEYNNFDFWSKYILVDTRTLYRNVKIGDNLKNRTFYFTFPDDMYTEISDGMALKCEDPYFTFNSSNFTVGGSLIAYCYPDWNDNSFICYAQDRTQDWSNLTQPHPYQYEEGKGLSANWDILYTAASKDMIVTDVYEDSIIYQNIFIREEELPLTIEEQALNLARLYYFNTTSGSGYTFSVATTRGEDVFVIQVTKNAAVQMWLTVNTTLGVVLEGSSNPTNEDYALALAEKYYKENYGNDTVYYGVATKKSETEFVIQVTQNAAVLMFLNVNVSTGEVTER